MMVDRSPIRVVMDGKEYSARAAFMAIGVGKALRGVLRPILRRTGLIVVWRDGRFHTLQVCQ
jgi:hypothetical protein